MRDLTAQAAWIAARQDTPFGWGTWDCVLFAAGAVQALTGQDKLSGIARWSDEKSALRALARHGGLEAAVSSVVDEVPVAMAMRGDVGAIDTEHGPMLVIIEGMTLAGISPEGMQRVERRLLVKAWSAGGMDQ